MAITFKIKRGTKLQNLAYTGQEGELTMQTDSGEESVRIHDGSTDGGFELGRADLKNVKIPLGGVTFEYFWHGTAISSGGSDTYPTDASLGTSDLAFGGTHYLYLDQEDRYNVDLSNFLDKISTVSATIIGQFRVYKKDDASKFKIFSITDSTKVTGGSHSGTHYRFEVEELASNLTLVDDDEIVISYVSAGEDAISVFLTKGNHSFLATSEGTVTDTLANGATEVRLFIGATQATFATTGAKNTYEVADFGADDWDNSTAYSVGNYAKDSGITYKALVANTNSQPTSSNANWISMGAYSVTPNSNSITFTESISNNQRVFTPTAMNKLYDSAVVNIPIRVYKADGSSVLLDRGITYTKTKVSKNIIIEADDYQIGYDAAGKTPDPNTYKITATPHGFDTVFTEVDEINHDVKTLVVTGSPDWAEGVSLTSGSGDTAAYAVVYKKTNANTYIITDVDGTLSGTITPSSGSTATFSSVTALASSTKTVRSVTNTTPHEVSITPPTRKFSRRTYTAKAYETEQGSQGADVLAQDSLTVFGTQAGTDGVTIIVTNENHSFQADENGYVSAYTDSGTFIEVY